MATLIFSSITASGDFTISFSTCKTQLAVGKSCKVNVTFTPEQLGQLSGTLTFTDNAPNSPQTVPLSGTGVSAVALTPASAKFGKVKVGATSKAKTFTCDFDDWGFRGVVNDVRVNPRGRPEVHDQRDVQADSEGGADRRTDRERQRPRQPPDSESERHGDIDAIWAASNESRT
jgi:hypothetical protein